MLRHVPWGRIRWAGIVLGVAAAILLLAGCVPSGGGGPLYGKKRQPIPGVVGMEVERACRTIGETGHVAEVSAVREAADVEQPGRVVAQDPKGGSKPGVEAVVSLTVSGPFSEKEVRPNTSCLTGPVE